MLYGEIDSWLENAENDIETWKNEITQIYHQTLYLEHGAITIDTENFTIQLTAQALGFVNGSAAYYYAAAEDEARSTSTTKFSETTNILAYDNNTKTIDIFNINQFCALGTDGYFIACYYKGIFYHSHINPDILITVDDVEYSAGDLMYEESTSYIRSSYATAILQNFADYIFIKYNDDAYLQDGYVGTASSANGVFNNTTSGNFKTWVMVPCTASLIYIQGYVGIEGSGYYNLNAYDSDGIFIEPVWRNDSSTYISNLEIELPEGTAYISLTTTLASYNKQNLNVYSKDTKFVEESDITELSENVSNLTNNVSILENTTTDLQDQIDAIDTNNYTRLAYFGKGTLYLDTSECTIYAGGSNNTTNLLATNNDDYIFVPYEEEARSWTAGTTTSMVILAYNKSTKTIDVFRGSQFNALGSNGYYIASLYQNKLYNSHISPDVTIILNGTSYLAGALDLNFNSTYLSNTFGTGSDMYDNDGISDIPLPKYIHCMQDRQLSCYYESLSRFEGSGNLYRFIFDFTKITSVTEICRNEYCWNFTPTADDSDSTITIHRLNRQTALSQESKTCTLKINRLLDTSLTKNVCICGDSLVDNTSLTKEVWRMLDEDADCEIIHVGTRGGTGYEHEGRGSWTWGKYLQGEDYASKSNAFWNTDDDCLDFQWYCEQNGYNGIDYFLIALGTNDVSLGTTAYPTFSSLNTIINNAKAFIDVLLSEDRGFPNCKVGIGLIGPGSDYCYTVNRSQYIFRKSVNTLNQLYLSTFDNGAYHENVTCFSHGSMTNAKYAFNYTDEPISDRYEETSRTLTRSVHPTARGYQAWADGYYNMIRGFLTEDAEAAETE